ncbi:hypothetical protein [Rhizobium ecuadorense]|uniref:hypothetical protein n=1 Tax=Rhizobium ecuadorense TaxID=1671795 RepID=UPI00067328DF|nr:hypothetical protein [Rhizobium ecuadorense]
MLPKAMGVDVKSCKEFAACPSFRFNGAEIIAGKRPILGTGKADVLGVQTRIVTPNDTVAILRARRQGAGLQLSAQPIEFVQNISDPGARLEHLFHFRIAGRFARDLQVGSVYRSVGDRVWKEDDFSHLHSLFGCFGGQETLMSPAPTAKGMRRVSLPIDRNILALHVSELRVFARS